MDTGTDVAALLRAGRATLGIELGSTRIKACLIGEDPSEVLATGNHTWENQYSGGLWTYSLDSVWQGVQASYADLIANVEARYGVRPTSVAALGVSAMMHGYLAFDAEEELLVPFRTWRNTNTGPAADALTQALGINIPLRWSVAHFYQAVLEAEPHVPDVDFITTLAGYVHWRLTGRKVLGVGDASGMFPIDSRTHTYDAARIAAFDELVGAELPGFTIAAILPEVLLAGQEAGTLTPEGARLLDPTGGLTPGIPLCPPEGDAGTGMVATNAISPRRGNVSAGTSIFAMVVLEHDLRQVHTEIDLVATPAGDPVAMVHCNNGASEIDEWASVFARFAQLAGLAPSRDEVFELLFTEALAGADDAGGLVSYNHLAGEPVAGLVDGRPVTVRTPDSSLSLANFMRSQLYGMFGTLALGMQILAGEEVRIDEVLAHGGVFRTAGVAQRFLAAALDAPVAVGELAGEGGAWGIAVLAAYLRRAGTSDLSTYLSEEVFHRSDVSVLAPRAEDVRGFGEFLERYRNGLPIVQAAAETL